MNSTKIEWCDKTLNPVVGCTYGCPYCYAKRINDRFHYIPDFLEPQFFPERLEQLKSKKPAKVFLTSMSDPADWKKKWVDAVISAIDENPQHQYLFLTKRPEAYSRLFPLWRHLDSDLMNIWYGVTVTSHDELHKIADLPISNRFISFEPLHGSADPRKRPVKVAVPWADWAIIGAETGPRSTHVRTEKEWVDEIVSYCDETGVPVFMKDSLIPVVGVDGMRRDFPKSLIGGESHVETVPRKSPRTVRGD